MSVVGCVAFALAYPLSSVLGVGLCSDMVKLDVLTDEFTPGVMARQPKILKKGQQKSHPDYHLRLRGLYGPGDLTAELLGLLF